MKISTLLILLTLQVSASSNYAQNVINLSEKNITISEVFKKIEKQSSYRFYYSNDVLPAEKLISINVINAPLTRVMPEVLNGTSLSWKIVSKTKVVVFSGEIDASLINAVALGIKGVVLNERGEPVDGASVLVKGTATGTTTSSTGEFTINAPEDAILVVSAVGYDPLEVAVGQSSIITITLKAHDTKLDEVVVVGYGTQKKTSLTASVSTVNGADMAQQPVSDLSNALGGRATGVLFTQPSGQAGNDASKILIRGIGTNGNSTPLLIVDGSSQELQPVESGRC